MSRVLTFGSSWTLRAALAHIEQIEAHDHALRVYRAIHGNDALEMGDLPLTEEMKRTVRRKTLDGLLLALRDGYVRATGRRSSTPGFMPRSESEAWRLHASDSTLITTADWCEGEFSALDDSLTGKTWQFIQIEVPDFMVKAIWPDQAPVVLRPATDDIMTQYTTPYLELMQEAIAHFAITPQRQEKKESLAAWFRAQKAEGKFVSSNLANSMATLIRLPTAQRGGAKRSSFRHLTQDTR